MGDTTIDIVIGCKEASLWTRRGGTLGNVSALETVYMNNIGVSLPTS